MGSDKPCTNWPTAWKSFLSTLPAWGATPAHGGISSADNISIHAPRVGSDVIHGPGDGGFVVISIHAPRVGSDETLGGNNMKTFIISIHAPRVGSDILQCVVLCDGSRFLSTLPAWGATGCGFGQSARKSHFYPRSPRGERPCMPPPALRKSSHFYPRSPRGERPGSGCKGLGISRISIHAPRVGSDVHRKRLGPGILQFLSTLPAWGATNTGGNVVHRYRISIHAPRVGSDLLFPGGLLIPHGFLSTLPAWGATLFFGSGVQT